MGKKRLLCYELNEVPWKVFDKYIELRPNSFFAKNLRHFQQLTTSTKDSGELHPWSTWPTMHRGVSNDEHNIRYINQSLVEAEAYPPVWEILAKNGITIGVFGSLQSFPVYEHANTLFYLPDTFSPAADSFPKSIQPFQKFNLKLAGKNKAVSSKIGIADLANSASTIKAGVGIESLFAAGKHLMAEFQDSKNRSFRPAMQTVFSFDVFWKLLEKKQPDFATFFTNHVAGLMHRYWKYMFPEDFANPPPQDEFFHFHKNTILKGMDIADQQIAQCFKFAQKNNYDFFVSTSMGQSAIDRGRYIPELFLPEAKKIARIFKCKGKVQLNPAMQPDVAFEFASREDLEHFLTESQEVVGPDGNKVLMLRYDPTGLTINFSVKSSQSIVDSGTILYRGKSLKVGDLGLQIIRRDPGTGYHCPEGIWLWSGSHAPKMSSRQLVDSRSYTPTILQFFGIPVPSYCITPPLANSSRVANEMAQPEFQI